MKITYVFVSNYLNHHQIPFCNEMYSALKESFVFIQTEPMEEERIKMGWNQNISLPYLKRYYEEPELCRDLIENAKVVMFGGCEDESYIAGRLQEGKSVVRCSERLYRWAQWKWISPKGLLKKYHDHIRYRKAPVYLLCNGAYVASDFHIIRAYPDKMYRWGYFPETKHYDVAKILNNKGWTTPEGERVPYLLWVARMIECKHTELAVETAKFLKQKGYRFHLDIVGDGAGRAAAEELCDKYGLREYVDFRGAGTPEQVREYMEKADIFLFTSDRIEGWGAVLNESMNSCCAVVADHMIGAAPFLIQDGENGLLYRDGCPEELFAMTELLVKDSDLCRRMGEKAYATITQGWNAESATRQLIRLMLQLQLLEKTDIREEIEKEVAEMQVPEEYSGPCSKAPVYSEKTVYKLLKNKGNSK